MLDWFERRLDPYPSEEPQRPPQGLLSFCWHYAQGAKRWLLLMSASAVVIAIIEVALFGFLGNIVDWLATVDRETLFRDEAPTLIMMSVILLMVFPAVALINTLVIHQTLLGNLPQRIRWQAHRYLLRQSMSYFQNEFAGRIATKLMQTSLAVREVVMKVLDVAVYVATYFIGALVYAFMADWRFAIPFVLWLGCYVVMVRYFVPRMARVAQEQADARSMMTGRVVDSYTNISTVKLFSHSRREESYAHEAMDGFLGTVHRQMRLGSLFEICVDWLNLGALFIVAGSGLYLWSIGEVTAGVVAGAIALIMRMNNMSHWIMWEMSALFENIGTVRDGINSISLPRIVRDAPGAVDMGRVEGAIAFEDVDFAYEAVGSANDNDEDAEAEMPARGASVIENLNLEIGAGEKIGLIGRSGAGKSTIVNMLLRFYDLDGGRIMIDGHDIAGVTQDSLRANVGVVTQDTSLLHRSVRDNIAYGRPDATDEEVMEAARLAEAHEFIMDLADAKGRRGYHAHVGERGVKLSGGQRQRIAIARVLLKNAPILVLDEATSALDSEVEAAIQGQLQHLMKGKTVIAIAHRLSTIAALDRLIVLDAGRIVEEGTHAELLEAGGHYARLWARQSGGFLDLDSETAAAE